MHQEVDCRACTGALVSGHFLFCFLLPGINNKVTNNATNTETRTQLIRWRKKEGRGGGTSELTADPVCVCVLYPCDRKRKRLWQVEVEENSLVITLLEKLENYRS